MYTGFRGLQIFPPSHFHKCTTTTMKIVFCYRSTSLECLERLADGRWIFALASRYTCIYIQKKFACLSLINLNRFSVGFFSIFFFFYKNKISFVFLHILYIITIFYILLSYYYTIFSAFYYILYTKKISIKHIKQVDF